MAAELSHTFAHARDADAETRFPWLRTTVGGKGHAVAEVDDFEGKKGVLLTEADLGSGTAGMTLNVGKGFLDDAKESDFERLRKTLEPGKGEQLRVDATALGETVCIFLEGGDKAKVVEKRGMKEVGESANFAGHLLCELAGFFERECSSLFL